MEKFDFVTEAHDIDEVINKDVADFEKRGKEISANNGANTAFKNKDLQKLVSRMEYRFANHINTIKYSDIASSDEISESANELNRVVKEAMEEIKDLNDVKANLNSNEFTYEDQKVISERLNALLTKVVDLIQEKVDKSSDLLKNKNPEKFDDEEVELKEDNKEEVKEEKAEKVEEVEDTDKDYKIEDFDLDDINRSVDATLDADEEVFQAVDVKTDSIEEDEKTEEDTKEVVEDEKEEATPEEDKETDEEKSVEDEEKELDDKLFAVHNDVDELRKAVELLESDSSQTLHVIDDEEEIKIQNAHNDYKVDPEKLAKEGWVHVDSVEEMDFDLQQEETDENVLKRAA